MSERKVWLKLFKLINEKDLGCVVLAKNEKQARQIANKETSEMFWTDSLKTECKEISFDSSPQMILKTILE